MRLCVRRKLRLYAGVNEQVYRTGYRCVSVCEKILAYLDASLYMSTGPGIGASQCTKEMELIETLHCTCLQNRV
jgi:hypothetical protein